LTDLFDEIIVGKVIAKKAVCTVQFFGPLCICDHKTP